MSRHFIGTVLFLFSLGFTMYSYAQKADVCYGCRLLESLDNSIKIIDDSAYSLIRNGFKDNCDSCFFRMVDSLKFRFIHTSDTKYIKAMSALADNSDGAYTEDFENADMFFKNFKPYCDYIYKSGDTGMLFFCTIRELMFQMYYDYTKPNLSRINEIKQFIAKNEKQYHITGSEKRFIDSFIDRAKHEGRLEDDSTSEEQ